MTILGIIFLMERLGIYDRVGLYNFSLHVPFFYLKNPLNMIHLMEKMKGKRHDKGR